MSGSNRTSDSIDSTSLEGYHCPNCDYDVRGLTVARCPECGEAFSLRRLAWHGDRRWPQQKFYRTLILAMIPWFVAYPCVDPINDTLNRVAINWLTGPFLAFSLHVALAAVAASCLEAKTPLRIKRFGAFLAIVVWILILGHVAITIGTL